MKFDFLNCYANPDDPRIWIGKPNRKLQVTVNLAHRRAWYITAVITGVTLLFSLAPIFFIPLNLESPAEFTVWIGSLAVWTIFLWIYCFRAAEKDYRQHGEPKQS